MSERNFAAADGLASAAIAGLLFCAYLFTASLTFISGDELFLFDYTESLAKHGSVWRSETAELDWPGESTTEPLQPLLAAPLYWFVNNFDGIGNVHGTLLFNPLITALTGMLVFLYLRRLAFDRATSITAALAFGLTTLAWPYTKTFFREPLTVFLIFACAFCLLCLREAIRNKDRGKRIWFLLALITGLSGMLTKEAAVFGVPTLLLILLPLVMARLRTPRDWAILFGISFVSLAIILSALAFFGNYMGIGRFDFVGRLGQMWANLALAQQGVAGFLISPGKSIFVYSPILLFALAAPFITERGKRWDVSWQFILVSVFVIIYSFVRGAEWFGGRNWGPRYMLPLTPFLVVSAAPLIQIALHGKPWLAKVAWIVLLIAGFAVQVGGTAVNLGDYDELVGAIAPGGPWTIAIWTPYYSPVLGHWRLMGAKAADFAWVQAAASPAWIVPILIVGVAAVFSAALYLSLTKTLKRRVMFLSVIGGFLLTGAMTWFSLRAIYYDRRYQGDISQLHQLNDALRQIDSPDPIIFLNNHAYFNFMMNYYKGNLWWYTLELNPKELLQEGEPRPAPSTDPTTLANLNARSVVEHFGEQRQTIYLIMEHSLFTPESPRPLEWWMSYRYFYEGVQEFSTTVRLVRFSSALAPKPNVPSAHPVNYQLGKTILLTGWDAVPDGARLRPGSTLNISTQWKAISKPEGDYKIAVYFISPTGAVIMQDDSIPLNTFWATTTWQTDDVIRHNIAFILPDDLLPGFYEVWTVMYSEADNQRLPVQDSSGTAIRDHIVLTTVEITR